MKILKGTLIGGAAYFILGWIIYGILFTGYFSAHMNQCAARPMDQMIWWAIIGSNLVTALLLNLLLNWAGAKTVVDGLKTGALFGLLVTLSFDLSSWSMTTMYNSLSTLVVDVAISTFLFAVIGMIILMLVKYHPEKN